MDSGQLALAVVAVEIEKFNDCHDEKGQFCETSGGSGSNVASRLADEKTDTEKGQAEHKALKKSQKAITQSPETKAAIRRYQKDSDQMNLSLSGDTGDTDWSRTSIGLLDNAIAQTSLPETTLFRGVAFEKSVLDKMVPGYQFKDSRFVSTTTQVLIANDFATVMYDRPEANNQVIFQVSVPKGSKGLAIGNTDGEVVLARGSSFKVTGSSKIKLPPSSALRKLGETRTREGTLIHVELIQPSTVKKFNDCHDDLGRFCETGGGGTSQDSGKPEDFEYQGTANVGGAHKKYMFKDKAGNQWLFKPARTLSGAPSPVTPPAEEAVSKIQEIVRPGYAVEVKAIELKGMDGSIQKMVPGVIDSSISVSKLTPDGIKQVQQEHVVDWLTSQHDSHPRQWIRTNDGKIIGLDKAQSFKYFGKDRLAIDYHPNSVYGETEPVYNSLFREISKGNKKFDPQDTYPAIQRAMSIPDAKYRQILDKYADVKTKMFGGSKKDFLDQAVARKNNLQNDFEKFYSKVLGQPFKFKVQKADVELARIVFEEEIEKYNPYHDEQGRFTSEEGESASQDKGQVKGQAKESYKLPGAQSHSQLRQKDMHQNKSWKKTKWTDQSYGGVIVNSQGQVLLRKPANYYGGAHWTFAKGGMDNANEHPVDTALREVTEETGHHGQILEQLDGTYEGTTGQTNYFLMKSSGSSPHLMDKETAEVRWADKEYAKELINRSTNPTVRDRDLQVLNQTFKQLEKYKK